MENNLNLKKEIFVHRKLIRWCSFFSVFSTIVFLLSIGVYSGFITKIDSNIYSSLQSGFICILFSLCIFLTGFSIVVSWILNTKILIKLKKIRKLYIPFFVFSFIIPFLTWLYCMGIISFMKNNKNDYFEWLKTEKVEKMISSNINHKIS